jgi:hypothetical protein
MLPLFRVAAASSLVLAVIAGLRSSVPNSSLMELAYIGALFAAAFVAHELIDIFKKK